jgi:hypothetical protein
MRKLIALLLAAGLFSAAHAAENVLTAKEKADGWVLLFDGKTTQGWRSYKKTEAGQQWQVIDGVLTLTAGGGRRRRSGHRQGLRQFRAGLRLAHLEAGQ